MRAHSTDGTKAIVFLVPHVHMAHMDALKNKRVPVQMTEDDVAQIDEWRRKQLKIPSRSEAIRQLVQKGLGKK